MLEKRYKTHMCYTTVRDVIAFEVDQHERWEAVLVVAHLGSQERVVHLVG